MRVVELFAGVGGFRLGFESVGFPTVWANQWEPGTKAQHAAEIYRRRFGAQAATFNQDIATVQAEDIPDHDLLCGGFPCQDYSAATVKAEGMTGTKGVLWWEIRRIIEAKRPAWVVLENVDRLPVAPATQRGRDMAVVLACFRDLGYSVAWRVVNAADYGVPQRRRRIFIVASRVGDPGDVVAQAFPATAEGVQADVIEGDLRTIQDAWGRKFAPAGFMQADGGFTHWTPRPRQVVPTATLGEILVAGPGREIDNLDRWGYVKGAKDEPRTAKNGFKYRFREGAVGFPDRLDMPSRTILTSEGGKGASRTTHVVKDPETGRLRTLRPMECERLQGFPDGWTEGAPESWRFKTMGNALPVAMVARLGAALAQLTGSHDRGDLQAGSPELAQLEGSRDRGAGTKDPYCRSGRQVALLSFDEEPRTNQGGA